MSFIFVMSVFSIATSRSKSGPFFSGRKCAVARVGPLPMNLPVDLAVAGPCANWFERFVTVSSTPERTRGTAGSSPC